MNSSSSKPRKLKFHVTNRGSDSSGEEEDRNKYRARVVRGPRSQHDLSSPSSTSSPAVEEPPPPPTPAPDTSIRSPQNPSPADRILILVTADSERYVNVDITDARNPAYIRECVFTKLSIFDDEDQARFSIYQTEIGAYAIGEALSDERLFELCHTLGDSRGTLKLLVSHSSAPIHEPSVRPLPTFIPSVNTIPPPVLPQPQPYPPLRPKRRPSSRNEGSVSSASEQPELAGYEADLDNPDRDSNRNTIRPTPVVVPPSPLNTRRPVPPFPSRPNSPPLPQTPSVNPLPQPPNHRDTIIDKYGNVIPTPPPPPPLSPSRSSFLNEDNNITPKSHLRTGSDAAADRERYLPDFRSQSNRMIPEPSQARGSKSREYDDSWVVVPDKNQIQQESFPTSELSRRAARHHVSPTRYKATSGKTLNIPAPPSHPPPAVPASSNDSRPARHAGHPVPPKWTVTWKREEKGSVEQKPFPSSSSFHRLAKGAKSMDNIRAFANYPTSLQPGGNRSRPNVNHSAPRPNGGMPFANSSTTSTSRSVRPLPIQGNPIQTLSPEAPPYVRTPSHSLGFMSPSQDPYIRPQSASGDAVLSPTQTQRTNHQRPYQFDPESARSPGSLLPAHLYVPTNGSRSTSALSDWYADDRHSSRSSPPRSPNSPRNPPISHDQVNGFDTLVDLNGRSKRNSDATLRKEDYPWMSKFPDRPSESTLVTSDSSKHQSDNSFISTSLPSVDTSPLDSYGTFRSFRSTSSADSDDTGTSLSIWNRPPAADQRSKSGQRPPLTVQIETSNGVQPVSIPSSSNQSSQQSTRAPSTPVYSFTSSSPSPTSRASRKAKSRASVFGAVEDEDDGSWAPRPPPEDMYDRLEEYFPEHDLDKPIIEAGSGGTSPTTVDQSPALPVPHPPEKEKTRIRGKKSIRIVAEEHKKRIDRNSRVETSTLANVLRKRSTKLWGSKIEEVTTDRIKEKPIVPSHPESPSAPSKSFTWVKGGLIGKGTYGRVYLAMNATTGEMMAVKQVEIPHTASDKNDSRQVTVVQALKMESETLKDLDHPNIVQYLGFEETPENLSIFLEYVPGGSIGSVLLKHGKFAEDVTRSFTGQILAGLEYLHSKGILHRDLKADNILVEMSGVCKISDFGISKRTDDDDGGAVTAMQGTIFWMAPEVVNPTPRGYNFKADIWSVGCVVLEMWAGMRPWQGDEMVAVMFKLYQSKLLPPVPTGVVLSQLADDFRMKCFAINPDERPSAAELRNHAYLQLPPGWEFNGFT